MEPHSYMIGEIAHLEHERSVQRAEARARLKGYPPDRRSGLRLLWRQHAGMWAPCEAPQGVVLKAICRFSPSG
jgi:hypothetical protein